MKSKKEFVLTKYYLNFYMDALIVYPDNKEQLTALKASTKAMKIAFESKAEVYPDHVVKGVKRAIQQADNGQLKPYTGVRNMLKGQ